ncbi:HK97 gp10 family phage protein [Blautia sp.]|uniref:HK97 gp10 family phage protein n=1 Tax=Blautia sp. TaxID=1955243 RepID=UPI003AB47198
MGRGIPISQLSAAVMEELEEYADLAAEDMKSAVKKAAATVRKDIEAGAPRNTGDYAKSWAVKTTKESSNALQVTVYSRNRYQIAHLLEYGHAKRGGGRVAAKPHIAAAEEVGIEQLEREIERSLTNG